MDLQPCRGEDKVAIPVSFDTKWETQELKISKLYISLAICAVAFIGWVVVMFIAADNSIRLWASIILLIGVPTFLRYAFIGEHTWKKNFLELNDNDYQYDYSLFWNIYDTSTTEPTFFFHTTGNNSLFVAFDKDVVVGKGDDSGFDHYEAISDAYNLLSKKGIVCTHIDYMDNVGKDVRLMEMMDEVSHTCKSEDLKNCVLDMYEYMQWYMSDTFTDYDVYCFTSKMRIDLMLDELTPVLSAMLAGNYIRYRILDRQDVRALVSSVYALPDFSVTRSCDSLFASRGVSSYIKIIWTEKDGKREKVNKTRAEIQEEARIQQAEKEARKATRSNKKITNNAAVDIFADETAQPAQAQVKQPEKGTQPEQASPFAQFNQATAQKKPTQNTTFGASTSKQQLPATSSKLQKPPKSNQQEVTPTQQGTISSQNDEDFDLFGD